MGRCVQLVGMNFFWGINVHTNATLDMCEMLTALDLKYLFHTIHQMLPTNKVTSSH